MKAVCVEIPVRSANTSKDKGKGRAPSNLVDGTEDTFVPDSEASLEYDDLVALLGESDDDDSDFEDNELDSEDEDDRGITLRSGRKSPKKRTSRPPVRPFDDVEKTAEIWFKAAVKTSIRATANGGASTSTGFTSRNVSRRSAPAAAAAEHRFIMERGLEVDSDIVPDSDFEGDVMVITDSEAERIAQRSRPNLGKGKDRDMGPEKPECDADDIRRDHFFARKEARRLSRLEKQEIRMLEIKLGRRLTHAEKSTIQLHKHHPELREAWGDLEAAVGTAEPQKAEQPSGLKVTLLPFQQESLYWMRKQEFGQYAGGLLADEMGMGKTIQMIALIVSGSTKPNLVVACVLVFIPLSSLRSFENNLDIPNFYISQSDSCDHAVAQ